MLQSALARRVAFLIVAAVLAWAGFGEARAQGTPDYSQCYNSSNYGSEAPYQPLCPTRQAAYEEGLKACNAYVASYGNSGDCAVNVVSVQGRYYRFRHPPTNGFSTHRAWAEECPVGNTWNDETKKCEGPKDCASEPDLPAASYVAADTEICSAGCKFAGKGGLCVGMTVDGQQNWYCSAWEPTGAECSAGEGDTPPAPTDGDGDGSSDGNDTSPNNPGQGGGGKDGKPQEDGGGKGDGNGSGEGSGNGNTSGGGGNCASPPSSSGDAILAQIAYQTWATRCSIEGAKDGNGNLKTTQGSGTGGGDGDGTDFGTSNPGQDDEFDPSDVKRFGIPVNTSMLDSEAIFGRGTCPVLSVTIYGETFSTTELQGWCDLLLIMRALVLLFGAFIALRILMGHNV